MAMDVNATLTKPVAIRYLCEHCNVSSMAMSAIKVKGAKRVGAIASDTALSDAQFDAQQAAADSLAKIQDDMRKGVWYAIRQKLLFQSQCLHCKKEQSWIQHMNKTLRTVMIVGIIFGLIGLGISPLVGFVSYILLTPILSVISDDGFIVFLASLVLAMFFVYGCVYWSKRITQNINMKKIKQLIEEASGHVNPKVYFGDEITHAIKDIVGEVEKSKEGNKL